MSLLKKLNIGYRIMSCPNCGQKIRLPVKQGKTLQAHCPKCHAKFEIKFSTVFSQLFNFQPHQTLSQKMHQLTTNYRKLPHKTKRGMMILMIILIIFAVMITTRKQASTPIQHQTPSQELVI